MQTRPPCAAPAAACFAWADLRRKPSGVGLTPLGGAGRLNRNHRRSEHVKLQTAISGCALDPDQPRATRQEPRETVPQTRSSWTPWTGTVTRMRPFETVSTNSFCLFLVLCALRLVVSSQDAVIPSILVLASITFISQSYSRCTHPGPCFFYTQQC